MSDASTRSMIAEYMEEASAPLFLSGFFQSPPRNFHTSEKVEVDVLRDEEEVAIVVQDLSAGARHNESAKFTNKAFTPPIFKESGSINAYDQIKRVAGQDPFQSPEFGAAAIDGAFTLGRKLERKIRRAIELMASQVLQTGKLVLTDGEGKSLFALDFQPKVTHFVTVDIAWGADGAKPLEDVGNLAQVVRRDGKHNPNRLVFGMDAFTKFLADEDVKQRLDNRNMQVGAVVPQTRGQGATFQGYVWIGHYRFEMWTYDGYYKAPVGGDPTPYLAEDAVLILSEGGRLDLTYGAIPRIVAPDQRALPFLPGRMSSSERGLDLTMNSWVTPDGESVMVSAGTRPLTIPTAIDTFGCLTVSGDS